jgi:hypothetical protein
MLLQTDPRNASASCLCKKEKRKGKESCHKHNLTNSRMNCRKGISLLRALQHGGKTEGEAENMEGKDIVWSRGAAGESRLCDFFFDPPVSAICLRHGNDAYAADAQLDLLLTLVNRLNW